MDFLGYCSFVTGDFPWNTSLDLVTISKFTSSPLSFYSESYQEVYRKITKEGEKTDLGLSYILYDKEGKGMEISSDGNEKTVFNVSAKYPHIFLIEQTFEENGVSYSFLYDNYLTHSYFAGNFSFNDEQEGRTFTIQALFSEGKIKEVDSLFYKDSSTGKVTFLDEDDALYKDTLSKVQKGLSKAYEALKNDFKTFFLMILILSLLISQFQKRMLNRLMIRPFFGEWCHRLES